jgi:hypothetical protein
MGGIDEIHEVLEMLGASARVGLLGHRESSVFASWNKLRDEHKGLVKEQNTGSISEANEADAVQSMEETGTDAPEPPSESHDDFEAMEELSECTEEDLSADDQRKVAEAKGRAKEERAAAIQRAEEEEKEYIEQAKQSAAEDIRLAIATAEEQAEKRIDGAKATQEAIFEETLRNTLHMIPPTFTPESQVKAPWRPLREASSRAFSRASIAGRWFTSMGSHMLTCTSHTDCLKAYQ